MQNANTCFNSGSALILTPFYDLRITTTIRYPFSSHSMAPRARSRKRGRTRMDAALDAMSPYGFPKQLVRRTVNQLLKVYGGNEGWVFIEDSAYTLLIDTLLEKQAAQPQGGLIEDKPGDGHNEALPAGCSNRALLPCSNIETSDDASPTNQAVDTVSAASETGNQLAIKAEDTVSATSESGNLLSIKPVDTISATSENGNQLPIKAVDTVSATSETGSQVPIKVVDTVSADNESDCQPAGNFALGEIDGITLAYSPPQTRSPQAVERLCHQRRRPCHGWISNDDEEELIELTPAPLSKVLSMLINDRVN